MMKQAAILLALLMAPVGPMRADGLETDRIVLGGDAALRWSAVGSLRVSGRPSCTAFLISQSEAITAAHCVVDRVSGKRVHPDRFVLVLGQRPNGFAAVRGVSEAAYLPGFVSSEPVMDMTGVSDDLALLQLDVPVNPDEAEPLAVEDWPNPIGEFVDIVGYERGGPRAATLREGCMAVESGKGVTAVKCDVITGLSGSPVLLSDKPEAAPRLVAAVSSRGNGAAFVVAIAPHLPELRRLIGE